MALFGLLPHATYILFQKKNYVCFVIHPREIKFFTQNKMGKLYHYKSILAVFTLKKYSI